MFGAWGSATPDGGLIQLRALDFGGGPFPNNTVVFVHRNTNGQSSTSTSGGVPAAAQDTRAFASVFFPGYVGAITGVAQSGIGISEKVWETYLPPPDDMQHGSYAGEADIFVLRDILQHARTKQEAEAYIDAANRTWGMWVGVGDFASQTFDVVAYRQNSSVAYTDATIGELTGQPFIANVAYVDRHPQPSRDGMVLLERACGGLLHVTGCFSNSNITT